MDRTRLTRLRNILTERFSKSELHTLCFDLDIPYESLPEAVDALAREMIVYCERRDCVSALIETARGLRPDIDWESLALVTPVAPGSVDTPVHVSQPPEEIDEAAIAAVAIKLLSPYLAQVGDATAMEGKGDAWRKVRQIHHFIASRLQEEQDGYLSETLKRFEEQPQSRQGAIQSVLQEILVKDRAFAHTLSALLQEADQAGAGAVFNVNVLGGEVGEIINIDRLDGGLTINKK